MKTALNIITSTNPKTIVTSENMVKGIYGKRHIAVNYDLGSDLFNVTAFTLKGFDMVKKAETKGVFMSDLKSTIEGLK